MNLIKAEYKKIKKEMLFYYPDYIVGTIVEILILFIILKLGNNINTSYFAYISWVLISGILSESVMCISTEKQLGTLQNLMTKPYTIFQIIFAKVFIWYLINLIKIIIISMALKIFIFSELIINLQIIATIVLESIGIFGLSFVMSAITLIYTKTASFETIISYLILFLSGAVTKLPDIIIHTNPISYCSIILSKIIRGEHIYLNLIVLFILSMIFLLIGYLLFNIVFKRSKEFSWNY